jgi:multiple sugar transport system permease protein
VLYRDRRILIMLMAPAMLLFAMLTLWPILRLATMSLRGGGTSIATSRFIGLENFDYLYSDLFFRTSAWNTAYFSIVSTLLEVAIGLAVALLLNREFFGRRIVVPVIILPYVLSTVVAASIWRAWFHHDYGFLNNVLATVGLPRIGWLSDPAFAMSAIMQIEVWQATSFTFLIIFAGLQSIPKEIVEASRVDGASPFVSLVTITLPLIRRYILLAALLRTIETFKVFDKIFITTQGGPGLSTEVLSLFVYKQAFRFSDIGLASAAALTMLAIGTTLAAIYGLLVTRRPT